MIKTTIYFREVFLSYDYLNINLARNIKALRLNYGFSKTDIVSLSCGFIKNKNLTRIESEGRFTGSGAILSIFSKMFNISIDEFFEDQITLCSDHIILKPGVADSQGFGKTHRKYLKESYIASGSLRVIIERLREFGVDTDLLLIQNKIEPLIFQFTNQYVNSHVTHLLLNEMKRVCGNKFKSVIPISQDYLRTFKNIPFRSTLQRSNENRAKRNPGIEVLRRTILRMDQLDQNCSYEIRELEKDLITISCKNLEHLKAYSFDPEIYLKVQHLRLSWFKTLGNSFEENSVISTTISNKEHESIFTLRALA